MDIESYVQYQASLHEDKNSAGRLARLDKFRYRSLARL